MSTVAPVPIPSIEAPDKEDVGNIIATTEGSIAILMPISGEYYTCLKWLQDDIIKNIPQYGALNNRNFRFSVLCNVKGVESINLMVC